MFVGYLFLSVCVPKWSTFILIAVAVLILAVYLSGCAKQKKYEDTIKENESLMEAERQRAAELTEQKNHEESVIIYMKSRYNI